MGRQHPDFVTGRESSSQVEDETRTTIARGGWKRTSRNEDSHVISDGSSLEDSALALNDSRYHIVPPLVQLHHEISYKAYASQCECNSEDHDRVGSHP